MDTNRFSNVLGEEYNLFSKSIPHHDEFQNAVAGSVGRYAASSQTDIIRVVEGGCGTGITTARILDADGRIVVLGIDNEEKTIRQAQAVLQEYGNRVDLRYEDLLAALQSLPNVSADVFASVWVIHNLSPEYRERLFSEIARVLKPGGLFVNGDKYAQNDRELHERDLRYQIEAFDVYDSLGRPDLKKEWTDHYHEDEKTKITESEQTDILQKLGFRNVGVQYRKGMEAIITATR